MRTLERTIEGPRSREESAREAVAFIAATLLAFPIDFGGRVYAGEIVLIAALPWLLLSRRGDRTVRLPAALLVLGGLWLAGQVITDLLADSAWQDLIRLWLEIVLTLVDLTALSLLLNSTRVIRVAVLGLCIGLLVVGALLPPPGAEISPWKWQFGFPATMLVVLATTINPVARHRRVSIAVVLLAAGVSLALDYRSLGLICGLTAAVLAARAFAFVDGVPKPSRALTSRRWAVVMVIAAGLLFTQVYSFAASNGLLGAGAQQRYNTEAGGALGLLVGGRVEILVSAQAFADAPVFGHGAYAQDFAYVALLADRLAALGYPVAVSDDGRIPAHSYLMGSAVEGGFFGFLFWLAIAIAVGRWLWTSSAATSPLTALSVFLCIQLLWDVFFSPFGGEARVTFALTIAVARYVVQFGSWVPSTPRSSARAWGPRFGEPRSVVARIPREEHHGVRPAPDL